jgi:hypothetical protein
MKKYLLTLLTAIFLASPMPAFAATLKLSPSSGTANIGCPFVVNVDLDTGGKETDGTDAILTYNTAALSTDTNSITNGTIYPDYPGTNVDSANGRITVSGLASVSTAYNGQGTLATIRFTVPQGAQAGSTQVKFDFDPNQTTKTTDSNVVERTTISDVLTSVTNGTYTIGTGTCTQQTLSNVPTSGTSGSGSTTTSTSTSKGGLETKTPVKTLPQGGTENFTAMIAIMGTALSILGVLGLMLL